MKRYLSLILAIAATVSAQIVPSTGNVRGPTSATDNAVARYDGTTGKLIQNSGVTIDDSGNLTVSGTGTIAGLTLSGGSFAAASLYKSASLGTVLSGATGSSYDLFITNPAGSYIIQTPTGTRGIEVAGNILTAGNLSATGGIVGTTTNDSAAAGIVGQYVSASVAYGARAANADGVIRNVTSISLTAGDWDVNGFVAFEGAGTTATILAGGVSASSATLDDPEFGQTRISVSGVTGNVGVQTTGTRRFSITSTTTVYLTSRAFFSAGTVETYGVIRARRVR